jgi:pyridoxal biosynthesis lyase PdxS
LIKRAKEFCTTIIHEKYDCKNILLDADKFVVDVKTILKKAKSDKNKVPIAIRYTDNQLRIVESFLNIGPLKTLPDKIRNAGGVNKMCGVEIVREFYYAAKSIM